MRKLLTLLLPVSLLLSAHVLAVSLGDELILSRLGDPVEIEIDVLQWEDIDLERVEISAATREEYDVFNLTWLPVLEELSFNMVGPDLDGDVRVLISSRDPLNEPFLELLLVLRWPGGSLRREYVLLFDPPGAPTPALTAVVASPSAESLERAAPQLPPAEDPITVADVPAAVVQVEETVALPVEEPLPVAELRENELPPVVESPVEEEFSQFIEVPVEEALPPVVALTVEEELPPVLELPVAGELPPAVALVVEEELPPVAETQAEEFPPLVDEDPPVAEPVPAIVSEPEPVTSEPAPQPEPEAPQLVATIVEEILEEEASPPPPDPEPLAPEPEESDVPDARTQIAIEVETLTPQPAPMALDTARRTYQVRSGDSLWNIARQFRPAGAGENLFQMLLSMHNLNRNSFINGNISLLKANAMLQVPTADDISAIDPLTAETEFDRRWNEGTQRFDAAQRGEPIPLFADGPPPEDLVEEVEDELPLGKEAPGVDANENALIMVSQTNVPQPLQIAPDAETTAAMPASESSATTELESEPVLIVETQTVAVSETQQQLPAPPATPTSVPVERTLTRAVLAAELEAEVAAMRTRRQSAEAVAQQLNVSLQRVQAERAAGASLFGTENLLLAGSSLLLFAALLVAVVFSFRIAGDLRLHTSDTALDRLPAPTWSKVPERAAVPERKEPHMPEMEVVELQMPTSAATELTQAAATDAADSPLAEDLFARMDDILGTDTRDSTKSG
jgi:FimV-like protein